MVEGFKGSGLWGSPIITTTFFNSSVGFFLRGVHSFLVTAVTIKHLSIMPKSWFRLELGAVSYTHLRAHETPEHLVCRLLLEKKKTIYSIAKKKKNIKKKTTKRINKNIKT